MTATALTETELTEHFNFLGYEGYDGRPATALYKYLGYDGLKKTLENRSVRLSTHYAFNDPFDMHLSDLFGADLRPFLRAMLEDILFGDLDYSQLKDGHFKDLLIEHRQALSNQLKNADDPQAVLRRYANERPIEQQTDTDSLAKQLADDLVKNMERGTTEAVEMLQQYFKFCGIFCTSTKHDNLLMWSHYSDSHQGGVITFAPSIGKDSRLAWSRPVLYSKDRPLMFKTARDLRQCSSLFMERISKLFVFKALHNIIYTKSHDWEYEQEWRLAISGFITDGERYGYLDFHAEELASVYLGCRMTDAGKKEIIDLAKKVNPNVEIYQATVSAREYKLLFAAV